MVPEAAADTRRALAAEAAAPVAVGSGIEIEGVTVSYRGTVVLDSLDLTIDPGEIMAVIGPSGSGKTTALRAVAGFVRPTRGRIRIDGRDVTDLPPYARSIGMVVQNYALFPHMRVDENVAFGPRARGATEAMVQTQVHDCLRLVGMSAFARRYPAELSGGQQQRVAIARALAIQPQVLLLDEPLSALDAQIRRAMLEELARLHRELPSLTVLYVTHDQTEALTLADRIAIMRDGRLMALGPSKALYRSPPNRFAAEFLGRANLLPVRLHATGPDGLARVRFGSRELLARSHPDLAPGRDCLLCIRPHDISLDGAAAVNEIAGVVDSVQWQGDLHSVTLEAEGRTLRLVSTPLRSPPEPGSLRTVCFAAEDAMLIAEEPGGA
ncbi:MAG TPA: ABC transporter ATP-binding protein [Acetobacteraceae bacterium]|nr:ABC transporter ATP-binding protein [Acetobacteraceae bacterium]